MIKKLWVDNFKSLNDFEISFTPFTVIVGNNSVGKSSVLQALDFLAGCMEEDFDIILERRGQQAQNIKSKFYNHAYSKIRFRCLVELEVEGAVRELEWALEIHAYVQKNSLVLSKEEVVDRQSGDSLLVFEEGGRAFMRGRGQGMASIAGFTYRSSIIGLIDEKRNGAEYPELCSIKRYFKNAESFELLSPDKMRLSSRGRTDTIGRSGDKLPSFIKCMDDERRTRFLEKIGIILGGKVESVSARTKGKPGWTMLEVTERYGEREISVTSQDLSDGMLRLLAFVAISEMDGGHTFMLLDEIENGINVNYAEQLIKMLEDITQEKRRQLIVTTHSTVFLDYIPAEDIIYLYRSQNGYTKAVALFELPAFKRRLQSFYPGEVLLNLSNEEILSEVMNRA